MEKLFKVLVVVAFFVSFLSASWFVLHNTIYFHTDIARDFLLMEDIIVNKKLALIGPRSGGIPGVFHGPAWLYLNLPVFVASGGNPVAVGWFWVLLTMMSIGIVFITTKKLTDTKIAFVASAVFGLIVANDAPNLFNPFGAVMLSPLYLYFLVHYTQKKRLKDLIFALFTIGMIIQFQMAWGVPVLLLSLPIIIRLILQKKKPFHMISFGILLIPLSTFILFDLRHHFLQISSVISYITKGDVNKPSVFSPPLFLSRIKDMLSSMFSYVSQGNSLISCILLIIFIGLLALFINKKSNKKSTFIFYALYLYLGFWGVTLLFKGTMWNYYFWPFFPLFCMVFSSLIYYVTISKKYYTTISCIILLTLIGVALFRLKGYDSTFFKMNSGLWNFYKVQAQSVYNNSPAEFGWYVYTADQYGYSTKYAMNYLQDEFPYNKEYKFQKKPVTFLIIFPSTNKYTSEDWWQKNQVKIDRNPDMKIKFTGGSYIEKYMLSKEEQAVSSDPNLLQDLTFR